MEYTLTIQDKIVEVPGVVTIRFKQPALKKIKYRAGQYITVVVTINGKKYRRPYSVSSAWGIDRTVDITVKAIAGGVVSNYILQEWQVGDAIPVMAPLGDYVLPDTCVQRKIFLWCAGSGITPNYALLKEVLQQRPEIERLILIYGARNSSETIFKPALDALARAHAGRMTIKYIYSGALPEDTAFYYQRIDSACITQLLEEETPADAYHYICGPAAMKELVAGELQQSGVDATQVIYESFRMPEQDEAPSGAVAAEVTLVQKEAETLLRAGKGETLLSACIAAGVDVLYSCQTGSCGLCRARVRDGKVAAVTARWQQLEQDECLLCSSYAASSSLTLDLTV